MDGRTLVPGNRNVHCWWAESAGTFAGRQWPYSFDSGPVGIRGGRGCALWICCAPVGKRDRPVVHGRGHGRGRAGMDGDGCAAAAAHDADGAERACVPAAMDGAKIVLPAQTTYKTGFMGAKTKPFAPKTGKTEKKTEKNVAKTKKDII